MLIDRTQANTEKKFPTCQKKMDTASQNETVGGEEKKTNHTGAARGNFRYFFRECKQAEIDELACW